MGFFRRQPGIGEVPLALLLLKLGLDHVGVGGLALLLALAGQRGEVGGFGAGALGNGKLVVGRNSSVVEAGDGGDQAAAGDFQFRGGHRGGCVGATQTRHLSHSDGLVHHALADILVNRIIGDEAGGGLRCSALACRCQRPVGLGVKVLVVIDDARQQGRTGDGPVEGGRPAAGYGRGVRRLTGLGAMDGFFERDRNGLSRSRLGGISGCGSGLRASWNDGRRQDKGNVCAGQQKKETASATRTG